MNELGEGWIVRVCSRELVEGLGCGWLDAMGKGTKHGRGVVH